MQQSLLFHIFVIFVGAAIFATIALYLRQALPVAYLLLGVVFGPSVLGVVGDSAMIADIGEVGIVFLLFLLGLNLFPQKLARLFSQTALVTLASSLVFFLIGLVVARLFGIPWAGSLVIGTAGVFSSTIIGLKLLPTTVLHHRHTGELIVSVLLLQDLIAIAALVAIDAFRDADFGLRSLLLVAALPMLGLIAWFGQRFVLIPLLTRFDRIQEYLFLLCIGWCLGIAQLAHEFGLSYSIGAFLAGVALAAHPVALHVAESLKPIRDFFLVMFFFALGAGFDTQSLPEIWLPATVLAIALLFCKPVVFGYLMRRQGESARVAGETGVRLGQMSEFSLLIAFVALNALMISPNAAYIVQLATLLTLLGSSYWIVRHYPTPVATDESLRRD